MTVATVVWLDMRKDGHGHDAFSGLSKDAPLKTLVRTVEVVNETRADLVAVIGGSGDLVKMPGFVAVSPDSECET